MEQKYKILVVEDDKEIREGIEIYLRNQGYQVFQAANGAEGLRWRSRRSCTWRLWI